MIAERISRLLRRRYAEQPRYDIGERPRLGERRVLVMAAENAAPPISTSRASAVQPAPPVTQGD
jgi:hypothetical protein